MVTLNTAVLAFATIILVAVATVLTITALRMARTRRRARQRIVENPNSHYTSPVVLQNETRHRWHNMRLDGLHEINRGEVVRLLAKLEVTSVDALRPAERLFLDRMAEIATTAPASDPPAMGRLGTPDLQHRPA
ncbi:MAG: hypothetical protein WEF86_00805 [Gemmatimonadota bacterium]